MYVKIFNIPKLTKKKKIDPSCAWGVKIKVLHLVKTVLVRLWRRFAALAVVRGPTVSLLLVKASPSDNKESRPIKSVAFAEPMLQMFTAASFQRRRRK